MKLLLPFLVLLLSSAGFNTCSAQFPSAFATNNCSNGVAIEYSISSLTASFPRLTNAADQPYTFKATLNILNTGEEDVKGWAVFIGYQHKEILVSAGGALLANGSSLPANVSNGVTLTNPSAILKTGIDTATDFSQMGVTLDLTGTEFGENVSALPSIVNLTNPGYSCTAPSRNGSNIMDVCCTKNNSVVTITDDGFLPLYEGDITILYDVYQAYSDNYWAKVTISNDSPFGRLDFWNLKWTWVNGEYIPTMQGAQTTEQDQNACISGPAGVSNPGKDFSQVMSCQTTPTIIDLDQYRANDSTVGRIEYCCRNGTLLPATLDPSKSKSVFQMNVNKIPPQNQNRTLIDPPINWKISGSFDSGYNCDQPRLVQPSQFPDPSSAQRTESAIMSWQVTCNVTSSQTSSPKCCVSFSAFYNDSVVPCKTCACGGCQSSQQTCSSTAEALLIPTELATVPFVNRTAKTLAWAELKHWPVPQVLPCADNCGVSVNWHLYSDFTNGWSARVTIFNWQGLQFADWFAGVELDNALAGFEDVYSFNHTLVNNTVLMYGLEGQNYLNGIYDNYPGIQQSILSFTKTGVPGNFSARGYFPTKVIFDGNECSIPDIIPTGSAGRLIPRVFAVLFLPVFLLSFGPFGLL